MKNAINLLSVVILASCCVVPDPVEIPYTEREPAIKLTPEQDDLLFTTFPVIYERLGARDNQCWGRVESLEHDIKSHNQSVKDGQPNP